MSTRNSLKKVTPVQSMNSFVQ